MPYHVLISNEPAADGRLAPALHPGLQRLEPTGFRSAVVDLAVPVHGVAAG